MNEKLLLQDLVVLLAKKSGITQKEADKFFRELFQLVLECIYENDIVKIKDFGTFKLTKINSRESVDVNTGEKIEIPAHYKMSFTPDRSLKELVNEPFSHFESVPLDDNETAEKGDGSTMAIPSTDARAKIDNEIIIEDFEEEDDDELLEVESDVENESASESETASDIQSVSPLDELSFLSEKPVAAKTDKPEEKQPKPEMKQSEKSTAPEKEVPSQEEKPKRKIDLIDLIDIKSLPKREIKIEEKKERPKSPPLLDLIDIKRERKPIGVKVETDTEKKVPEGDSIPEKTPIPEKSTIIEKAPIVEKASVVEKTPIQEKKEPIEEKVKIKEEAPVDVPPVVRAQPEPVIEKKVQERDTTPTPSYVPPHFEDDSSDLDYDYVDYEKLAQESNQKRKILIIAVVVIVALFAIYQFAKLFDVTHDFEYYINHVPPLTLSDSLPMLDEQSQSTVPPADAKSDTIAMVTKVDKTRDKLAPDINPLTNERVESNLDKLTQQLEAKSSVERKSVEISERLQIKVANKAEVYLSQK